MVSVERSWLGIEICYVVEKYSVIFITQLSKPAFFGISEWSTVAKEGQEAANSANKHIKNTYFVSLSCTAFRKNPANTHNQKQDCAVTTWRNV